MQKKCEKHEVSKKEEERAELRALPSFRDNSNQEMRKMKGDEGSKKNATV